MRSRFIYKLRNECQNSPSYDVNYEHVIAAPTEEAARACAAAVAADEGSAVWLSHWRSSCVAVGLYTRDTADDVCPIIITTAFNAG